MNGPLPPGYRFNPNPSGSCSWDSHHWQRYGKRTTICVACNGVIEPMPESDIITFEEIEKIIHISGCPKWNEASTEDCVYLRGHKYDALKRGQILAEVLGKRLETPEEYMNREGWQYMGSASDDA